MKPLVVRGSVHRVYVVGLVILVGVHGLGLTIAGTAAGQAVSRNPIKKQREIAR